MNAKALLFTLMLFSYSALSCDEDCQREKAEAKHNIEFSSYLNWEYCEGTHDEFVTQSIASLERYSSQNYDARYKGGIRNIKKYIETRIGWIKECNQYLSLTGKGPIFDDKETTESIFNALASLTQELEALIKGATYSSDTGADTDTVIQEKFGQLFVRVDHHKNIMNLESRRYVNR